MIDLLNDYKTPIERAKEIAQRERMIRKRKKITQAQMASRIGISLSTYKRFEATGNISLESLLMIASVLGCEDDFDKVFDHPDYSRALND